MLFKKNYPYVISLLVIAFILRLWAAAKIPFIYDEQYLLHLGEENIFNPGVLQSVVGNAMAKYYIGTLSIIKLGRTLFSADIMGIRLLFILFGTGSLLFVYKFVKENLNQSAGLLTLAILTFSQLHIGFSRLAIEYAPFFFFTALAVYFFFKAFSCKQKKYAYITGIILGTGFLFYPLILLLLPVFLIFLATEEKYKVWLKRKETYLAILLMCIPILPYLFICYKEFLHKLFEDKCVFALGVSLRPFYLYFAEIFAKLSEKINLFSWSILDEKIFITTPGGHMKLISEISNEIPFVHWVLSLCIFTGIFYCFYNKRNDVIRFSLIMFGFIFLVTSIINADTLLDDHNWAAITIYPGAILCSYMLTELRKRFKFFNLIIIGLIGYFIVNSLFFINLPENLYAVPRNELHKYYLHRAKIYLEQGEWNKAVHRCQLVLDKNPDKKTALEAREILGLISVAN